MATDTYYTILIVDDSPESVEILRQLLRSRYRLKVARDGARALEIASSDQSVDLVLLDIVMPDMDGYQVIEGLKANPQTSDLPVIFVSALGETVDKVRAFEAGGVDYITKPYQPEEILVRVKTHLDMLTLNRSLRSEIARRTEAELALQRANETLEKRVKARTAELAQANTRLTHEIHERTAIAQENARLLQQMRDLARHEQTAIEAERARISRELHDQFGQNLTAMKMDAVWLSRQALASDPQVAERLKSMSLLLDDTIQLVRQVARELRPGMLDDLGLLAALEWQSQEFTRRTGIECELTIKSDVASLGSDLDTAIYRIFQETLTNIARHAGATRVKVSLVVRKDSVDFSVSDNGRGITPEQVQNGHSFGLLGIRERVRIWQGEISIAGGPRKGTTIRVQIPISNRH